MSSASLHGDAVAATTGELIDLAPLGGQESRLLDHVEGWLSAAGVGVERSIRPVADLVSHPAYGAEIEREAVEVMCARVGRAAGGRRLLLNAHVDVVPATNQPGWLGDPHVARRREGWLIGRGAADTLGGLAAAMHVLALLAAQERTGEGIGGEVLLTPVVGEEDGGCGTLATLVGRPDSSPLGAVDGVVVIEPTDLAIAPASAGALCFRVAVPGRTAHGSVRHSGVSAIEKGWLIHRRLLELEGVRAVRHRHPLYDADVPFPLCMGRIEGGDYRCDEAAWLVIEGRLGTAPQEPVAAARAELEVAVAAAAEEDPWLRDHPPVVSWVGAQWLGADTPLSDPIVGALRDARPGAPVVGVPYGCDLGLLRQVGGIPGVVFGPGQTARAHAPEEQVRIADLGEAAQIMHRLARGFAG